MQLSEKIQHRLVVALAMAESEIHNPGASRFQGFDIVALIECVLKEAGRDSLNLAMKTVREELKCSHPFPY